MNFLKDQITELHSSIEKVPQEPQYSLRAEIEEADRHFADKTTKNEATGRSALSAEDIAEIVIRTLESIKIYVVESEITAAQQNIKAAVESSKII